VAGVQGKYVPQHEGRVRSYQGSESSTACTAQKGTRSCREIGKPARQRSSHREDPYFFNKGERRKEEEEKGTREPMNLTGSRQKVDGTATRRHHLGFDWGESSEQHVRILVHATELPAKRRILKRGEYGTVRRGGKKADAQPCLKGLDAHETVGRTPSPIWHVTKIFCPGEKRARR